MAKTNPDPQILMSQADQLLKRIGAFDDEDPDDESLTAELLTCSQQHLQILHELAGQGYVPVNVEKTPWTWRRQG